MTPETPRLSLDEVPDKEQIWVERALVAPLNRFLSQLAAVTRRIRTAILNVQVVTHKFTAPAAWTDSEALQTISSIQGEVLGVVLLRLRLLDAGGAPTTTLAGNLRWEVRASKNRAAVLVRILEVTGVSAGQKYQVEALVIGD